jgi:hypothetical protein
MGEMKMKAISSSILCLGAVLFTAPALRGQDFSKYRDFSLGTSLASVLKHTDKKLADVNVTHEGRPLFQEMTWWPPSIPGPSFRADSVEQILFSFYNGELYKITVIYDQTSTEGLTSQDMVKSITATYGPATSVEPEMDSTTIERYDVKQKPVASWEDSQYSFNLVRSAFTDRFGLVISSKRVNAEAELAIVEAARLDKEDGPKKEVARQKKRTDDLEAARLKNQKKFRP